VVWCSQTARLQPHRIIQLDAITRTTKLSGLKLLHEQFRGRSTREVRQAILRQLSECTRAQEPDSLEALAVAQQVVRKRRGGKGGRAEYVIRASQPHGHVRVTGREKLGRLFEEFKEKKKRRFLHLRDKRGA